MIGSTRSDLRWRIIVFLILITYCYVMHKTIGVRPDHFFLSLIVLVFLFFGRQWGMKFLLDWSPFIIFWIAYDMMHGIADSMRGYIFVAEPLNLERHLFGWLTGFPVPAFYLQQFQISHGYVPAAFHSPAFARMVFLAHAEREEDILPVRLHLHRTKRHGAHNVHGLPLRTPLVRL